jgi:hypothetical protein
VVSIGADQARTESLRGQACSYLPRGIHYLGRLVGRTITLGASLIAAEAFIVPESVSEALAHPAEAAEAYIPPTYNNSDNTSCTNLPALPKTKQSVYQAKGWVETVHGENTVPAKGGSFPYGITIKETLQKMVTVKTYVNYQSDIGGSDHHFIYTQNVKKGEVAVHCFIADIARYTGSPGDNTTINVISYIPNRQRPVADEHYNIAYN